MTNEDTKGIIIIRKSVNRRTDNQSAKEKLAVMYICVKGIDFEPVSTIVKLYLKMF